MLVFSCFSAASKGTILSVTTHQVTMKRLSLYLSLVSLLQPSPSPSVYYLCALIYEVTQNNFIITHSPTIISFIEQTFASYRINSERSSSREKKNKARLVAREKYVNEKGKTQKESVLCTEIVD